jgi:transposase-like protein
VPTAYGAEFRQDLIEVACKGGAPLAQIAKDSGLSVTTLERWLAIAERKVPGAGAVPSSVNASSFSSHRTGALPTGQAPANPVRSSL